MSKRAYRSNAPHHRLAIRNRRFMPLDEEMWIGCGNAIHGEGVADTHRVAGVSEHRLLRWKLIDAEIDHPSRKRAFIPQLRSLRRRQGSVNASIDAQPAAEIDPRFMRRVVNVARDGVAEARDEMLRSARSYGAERALEQRVYGGIGLRDFHQIEWGADSSRTKAGKKCKHAGEVSAESLFYPRIMLRSVACDTGGLRK